MQPAPSRLGRILGSKSPVAAIVLTFLGAILYFPWAFWLFGGFAELGQFPLQSNVLFLSDLVVLGCTGILLARPQNHLLIGILILIVSAIAIGVDGYILVDLATAGLVGFLWSVPLAWVLIGGTLAIFWKPSVQPEPQNTIEIVTQTPPVVGSRPSLLSRVGLRGRGIIAAVGLGVFWVSGFVATTLYNEGPGSSVCTNNGCAILVVISAVGYYSAIIAGLFFAYGVYQRFRRSRQEKKQS